MAQFLRPDGTLASNNLRLYNAPTAHEAVDEEVYTGNPRDHFHSPDSGSSSARLSFSSPGSTPASGTCTLRWRYVRVRLGGGSNGNYAGGGGGNPSATVTLYENGIAIPSVTDTISSTGTTSIAGSVTFSTALISDWDDVEVLCNMTANGGGANARGCGVAWLEIETPEAAAPLVTRYVLVT